MKRKRRINKLKPRGIKRGRGRPPYIKNIYIYIYIYIYILYIYNIYIYFGGRGVFGRLLKTFAALILDLLLI